MTPHAALRGPQKPAQRRSVSMQAKRAALYPSAGKAMLLPHKGASEGLSTQLVRTS
jgi:hypothetical protein